MVKMTSVWEATTGFLRDHFGPVMAVAGPLVFLPNLLSGIIEGAAATAATPAAMTLRGLATLLLMIVTLWGGAAITALATRPSRAGFAIGHAARRLPAIIGVTLLLLVAVVALTLPILIILAAGGVGIAALAAPMMPAIGGGTALALFAYGVLLAAAFLWIAARLAVLVPVILAERRGIGAIRRSWTLTRGHGWRLVGVYLLYAIVALVVSGAVGAVGGIVAVLLSGGTPGLNPGTIFVALAMSMVATLLTLIQSAFVGRLYAALAPAEDLRETFA